MTEIQNLLHKEGHGIKRKNEKADLEKVEKITHKECTLDWSQSKVFLVIV